MTKTVGSFDQVESSEMIVLCATQRCGSTMIVEDMRNTEVLGRPEEWFIGWTPEKTDVDWSKALKNLKTKASGENGVSAVKVMANQLFDVEECLKSFLKPVPGPRFFRFHKAFENAKWVKLTRRNIVAQAISRIMAQQTGINHATGSSETDHFAGNLMKGYTEDYNVRAAYSYEAILREATSITLENLAWDLFFKDQGITPVEFIYEEVTADKDMKHLDRMAELVGLKSTPSRQQRAMVKIGNERNKEFEKRFLRDAAEKKYRP